MQAHPATQITLLQLSPEILSMISQHLKPRHLYKLMQTSKQVKSIVDSEEYWSRAAVHAVFRHFPATEIMDCDDESRIYPKLTGLYNLVNLDMGYYETINKIISRVRNMMATESEPPANDPLLNWKELAGAPLSTLVRAGEAAVRVDPFEYQDAYIAYLQDAETMKDVVKRETLREMKIMTPLDIKLRKFQREMDDDSSQSIQTKRCFMQKFSRLCSDIGYHEMLETDLWSFSSVLGDF